jgi:NACalpha-BTF3-like transcription factor
MQEQNPDAILAVRFYAHEVENAFESQTQGRPIFDMRDFVRIEVPGNNLSIIDTFANEDHKRRFPIQWAHYKNTSQTSGETFNSGTPLREWSLVNAAQAKELEHYRFYTVEQIANASDQQLQSVGMIAGMSPIGFREKARTYLSSAKDTALVMQQADAIAKAESDAKALRQQMAEMAETIKALTDRVEGRAEPEKRGPGRPRKEAEAA